MTPMTPERRFPLLMAAVITVIWAMILGEAVLGKPMDTPGMTAIQRGAAPIQPGGDDTHIPAPSRPSCNLHGYRSDAALADFNASGKESPGAIGPELLPPNKQTGVGYHEGYHYDVIKAARKLWVVVCGSPTHPPNSLVGLGLLTAMNKGVTPRFATKKAQAAAVERLMNEHYDGAYSVVCGDDPAGYRTVFGDTSTGKLRLGVTTVQKARYSCYLTLHFVFGEVTRWIDFRLECRQVSATDVHATHRGKVTWYTEVPTHV